MKQGAVMKIKSEMRHFMRRTLSICSAGMLFAASAYADSVNDMCKKADEVCACAASQLKKDIGNDSYELYEAVGAAYIAKQSKGMKMGDAWDAAVKTEANKRGTGFTQILSQTNAIGKTHRNAIKGCAG